MVLQRFIRFVAQKAVDGSKEHEQFLEKSADKHPEITDDVITAYIEATTPAANEPPSEPPFTPPVDVSPAGSPVKWCSYHKRFEPLTNFYTNKKSKDGYTWACKDYYNRPRKRHEAAADTQFALPAITEQPGQFLTGQQRRELDAKAPLGYLVCSACGNYKPEVQFSRDMTKPAMAYRNYRRAVCKSCANKRK